MRSHRARQGRTRLRKAPQVSPAAGADLVDLLLVGVEAGLTGELALAQALPFADPSLQQLLSPVSAALALGAGLGTSRARLRQPPAYVGDLLDCLRDAASLGTPLGDRLRETADNLRGRQRRAAEIRARSLPTRLLFPLVLLVLPSFVLLGVVPLVLGVLRATP